MDELLICLWNALKYSKREKEKKARGLYNQEQEKVMVVKAGTQIQSGFIFQSSPLFIVF